MLRYKAEYGSTFNECGSETLPPYLCMLGGVKLVLDRLKADTQDLTVLINMAQWTQVSVMRGELGSLN